MMTTGPVAFASAGAVCAEAEALEPVDPEHPESANAPQKTGADRAFHRQFLRESRGFVEPGWERVGCWISVRLCAWETRGGNWGQGLRSEDKRRLVGTGSDTQ